VTLVTWLDDQHIKSASWTPIRSRAKILKHVSTLNYGPSTELTDLPKRSLLGRVFLLSLQSRTSRGGATRRSKAAGPIDKIDCSKRSVKSKLERQP